MVDESNKAEFLFKNLYKKKIYHSHDNKQFPLFYSKKCQRTFLIFLFHGHKKMWDGPPKLGMDREEKIHAKYKKNGRIR